MAELKKSLGFTTIIALTITAMVGTGMFLGTAIGARYSGNAVLIAWALLIILAVYVAACFGELIALFPTAGGVYEFSKHAYGRFPSFIIGWVTWVMSNVAMTVLIVAALEHIMPPTAGVTVRIGLAISFILLLNFIAFLGVDFSAAILIIFAVETILLFLSIIIPGLFKVNFSNFTPLFTAPFSMVFVSLFFMLESLMGWESASFLAEETKNAERVIPYALIITTLLAGILGFLMAFVTLGIIPWNQLINSSAPANELSFIILGALGTKIMAIGIVLALLGSVTGSIISTPRLILAMARDKLFITQFAEIHKLTRTPYKAIIFQTIVSIILVFLAFGQYEKLLAMATVLALIMYLLIILAVPILRYKMPDAVRAFKVPFGKIGPVIVSIIYSGTILSWLFLTPDSFGVFNLTMSLLLFAIPIYVLLSFYYNPDAITSFLNKFAIVNLILENFLLPKFVRKKIMGIYQDLDGKFILDYGCGVGSLTILLAKAVGKRGRVISTDISNRNIAILKKRLIKRRLINVRLIHDVHHSNRVHPDVRNVDIVFSVGFISYIQDPNKVLHDIKRILPEHGRICFVEYVNFFKFIPDKEWLSKEANIKKTFREAGFSVKIEKTSGLFWNYLYIYGVKSERGCSCNLKSCSAF